MNADNGTAGGGPTEEEAGYSVSHSHYTFNGFGLVFTGLAVGISLSTSLLIRNCFWNFGSHLVSDFYVLSKSGVYYIP